MNRYTFTVRLIGLGDSIEEAWRDAVESTCLDKDPPPLDVEMESEEDCDEIYGE